MTHIPTRTTTAIAVPLLLAALAGCSSGPADYTKDGASAAVVYAAALGALPDQPTDADANRFLARVKGYCEGVKGSSIGTEDDTLDGDTARLMRGAAELYCPGVMQAAKR